MGDRLVIWGTGNNTEGRYLASKDVSGAAIAQSGGGILVDWGAGDTEVLTGQTWDTSQQDGTHIVSGVSPGSCPSWFKRPSGGGGYACRAIPRTGVVLGSTVFRNSAPYPSVFTTGFEETDCLPRTPGASNLYYVAGSSNEGNFSYLFTWSNTACSPIFNLVSLTPVVLSYTVTTNTGETSTRNSPASVPSISLIPNSCAIAITFADGTSKEIPLESCPDWIQTKPLNSCPDGTVKECQHGATVCCYGCVDGRLTLIDSFNKTG